MNIVMLATEAAPFAREGNLGDFTTRLCSGCVQLGHEVTLMLPLYSGITVRPMGIMSPLRFNFARREITYSILESRHQGIHLVLIDAPHYFHREGIYGDAKGSFGDNDERFIFFTRACLDYFIRKDRKPDVFHANDWPTALTAVYLKAHYKDDPLGETPVLLTIHNAEYQGVFSKDRYHLLDLGWEYFTSEGLEFYDSVNFLKGGILYSDLLNTLTEEYAGKIQTPEFGFKLEGALQRRKERLSGALTPEESLVFDPAVEDSWPPVAEKYSLLYNRAAGLKS